ncbi:MAG: hypothetical protein BHV98_08140 [Clostridium sp. CAG:217_53_7]|nr:MAG: hypothetical protein BHV98_08140 [Clostridium sp. CAG:217_53_7]
MKRRPVPIHETGYICASLAMVSGFLETYTYLLKGGVFANAQTGNFALLGMAIAHGDVKKVFTYLIPMCFYVVGIAMTVTMPRLLDENKLLRWDTVFVALEIGLLFVVGCLPKSVPFTVSTVTVAFICAMQYNTFKRTNNITKLCLIALHFLAYIPTKEHQSLKDSLTYMMINGSFLLGAVIGTLCARWLGDRAVWVCCGVLVPVLLSLIFGKREVESELLAEERQELAVEERALEEEQRELQEEDK